MAGAAAGRDGVPHAAGVPKQHNVGICWFHPEHACSPLHSSLSAVNVTYQGGVYTATYVFDVDPAWISPQPITYRYALAHGALAAVVALSPHLSCCPMPPSA